MLTMARETVEYKGHVIEAQTHKAGSAYSWSYTIDGSNYRESRDRPLKSEQVMLHEAVDAAKRHVDSMPNA